MAHQAPDPLHWRYNGHDGVSKHQPHHCLFNRLFRRRSKKTSKRRVTGLCAGNSPVTGEFPAQMASNAEIVPLLWRHHTLSLVTMIHIATHYITHDIQVLILIAYTWTGSTFSDEDGACMCQWWQCWSRLCVTYCCIPGAVSFILCKTMAMKLYEHHGVSIHRELHCLSETLFI